jgi:hypothetical protein
LNQHHLYIAQVIQAIQLILESAAHFLEPRMRIGAASNIEYGQ